MSISDDIFLEIAKNKELYYNVTRIEISEKYYKELLDNLHVPPPDLRGEYTGLFCGIPIFINKTIDGFVMLSAKK